MKIRKGFTFRLKPNREAERRLRRAAGCVRFVWNRALALQKERLDQGQPVETYAAMCKRLTIWKGDETTRFLAVAPSQPLQQKLKDLARAFADALDANQPHKAFPRFKKRGRDEDAFRYPQGVKLHGRRIWLPKIGWVRLYKSQEVQGEVKNVTLRYRGAHWYVSIQTEYVVPDPVHPCDSVVGGDLGIARFITLSDGSFVPTCTKWNRHVQKLKNAQRTLARREKGSNNWKKQKTKIARLHRKIADSRRDFLHKTSTAISKNHAIVVLEDLAVKQMSRSAKGTEEQPGRNVRQKASLNRAILDQGWSEFRRQLAYKLDWRGGRLVLVSPRYTSQRCSACGHVAAENRVERDLLSCIRCGHQIHADLNAAKNILAAGHAVMACGSNHERPIGRGRKQEPLAAQS